MIDRKHAGTRCCTVRHIMTRDGLLRCDTHGTIRYEMDNLGRHLVFVEWDNGMDVFMFPEEIEICGPPERLAA